MAQPHKGNPGGAWYLPALDACRFKIDGSSIVDGAPLPQRKAELHKLIARYREALERAKESICPAGLMCNHFDELAKQKDIKFSLWCDLSLEERKQYASEAMDLLRKFI